MALARILVVGPLASSRGAAKRLEAGKDLDTDVDIRSDDEVGQLAGAFRSMASAIHVREERINAAQPRHAAWCSTTSARASSAWIARASSPPSARA